MSLQIVILNILFLAWPITADRSRETLRSYYQQVNTSEQATERLLNFCRHNEILSSNLLQAYEGAATICMARYKTNPAHKLSLFYSGQKKLETAIAADPQNVELLYLRYTIQDNVPAFLGYRNDLRRDREAIIKEMERIRVEDTQLYAIIKSYFILKNIASA